jgi:phosphate transport system substrate-binding protein
MVFRENVADAGRRIQSYLSSMALAKKRRTLMFCRDRKQWLWSMFWLLLSGLILTPAARSEIIKIGGTGNALGTMQRLAEVYSRINPRIEITILPSIGSSGAIKAVPQGAIDIGLSSRPLKESESGSGITTVEYARSPTVIAVSDHSAVAEISDGQLVDIYTGRLTRWPDGTLIRPIIRQPGDDNTVQLKTLSPALKEAVEVADTRTGLLFAATDQETVDMIENTPGSFGVTTLALILSENRRMHGLKLDGIQPTPEECVAGRYPLIKHFYFILPPSPPAHVQDFIKFIKSSAGTAVLTQFGNYVAQ